MNNDEVDSTASSNNSDKIDHYHNLTPICLLVDVSTINIDGGGDGGGGIDDQELSSSDSLINWV